MSKLKTVKEPKKLVPMLDSSGKLWKWPVCSSCNVCWLEPDQTICYDCENIMSEITTVAAAFVKAQKEFAPALKSSTNPHFRSKYASLDACIEAVIDALNSAGIGLMQKTHEVEGGVCVETVFVHESGEQLSGGRLFVPANKNDAQGFGSALTYARRYSLMAACGQAPEDDDGQSAVRSAPATQAASSGKPDYTANGVKMFVSNASQDVKDKAKAALAGRKISDLNATELIELRDSL